MLPPPVLQASCREPWHHVIDCLATEHSLPPGIRTLFASFSTMLAFSSDNKSIRHSRVHFTVSLLGKLTCNQPRRGACSPSRRRAARRPSARCATGSIRRRSTIVIRRHRAHQRGKVDLHPRVGGQARRAAWRRREREADERAAEKLEKGPLEADGDAHGGPAAARAPGAKLARRAPPARRPPRPAKRTGIERTRRPTRAGRAPSRRWRPSCAAGRCTCTTSWRTRGCDSPLAQMA